MASMLNTVSVTLTLQSGQCDKLFTAKRKSARCCCNACRVKAFRGNRVSEETSATKKTNRLKDKIKRLARSAYGRWLVGHLKRASTVQVLQGAKAADLSALASLKAACSAANGYKQKNSMRSVINTL